MPARNKFGAFAGVFTPSLLTILGVIMYMRLGWVVGNAGLAGTIIIIVIAHVISITTGLSISSIATDKKIGAGGVYYVLSRSLGLPIGGAIGMTLFIGTALSIALYLIGFAESFNAYFNLDITINGLRFGGTIALATITALALISTSLALKTQFFIMAAIGLSLVSIFLGVAPSVPEGAGFIPSKENVSLEAIFAIFFPAVTGFTAGIAMSGDLKDPKKSIPSGTLWAIGVGFIVYMVLAVFIYYSVDPQLLKTDNNILLKLALFAPAVVAGIWGATLSSALGGILGAPRILQAMSVDKITPKFFGKGVGKGNDPRNALFLTMLIAEAGILIGELDTIARVCSMFYLAAYGFINLSFFLESWASTDFNPTFKVKRWVGLLGFIATFIVMFRLDMVAMIVAFIVIGGIYFLLAKKQLALGFGDVWQSVWSSIVKTGLRRMDDKKDNKRNWKPNVLLFSGGTDHRPHLLELSKELVGNRGIVTNFDLHENKKAKLLFPKDQQSVTDEILKTYGVFGRKLEVNNVFKGIETIASTFGFSGIEPNTILMGWAKNTSDPLWFAQMTQKLVELDFNVLYLDYDKRFGYRNYAKIDLWWRGKSNNAELMLNICKFLVASQLWRNAEIRILLVDDTNTNKKVVEQKVKGYLEERRVLAAVKIVSNAADKKPLYELMKTYSSEADLILVGIPEVKLEDAKNFVKSTNDLVGTIGTTLLVKASTYFGEINFLPPSVTTISSEAEVTPALKFPPLTKLDVPLLDVEIENLDHWLEEEISLFTKECFDPIGEKYLELYQLLYEEVEALKGNTVPVPEAYFRFSTLLTTLQIKLEEMRLEELPILMGIFAEEHTSYNDRLATVYKKLPLRCKVDYNERSFNFRMRKISEIYSLNYLTPALHNIYLKFGSSCFENLTKTVNELISRSYHLFDQSGFAENSQKTTLELENIMAELMEMLRPQITYFSRVASGIRSELSLSKRGMLNDMCTYLDDALKSGVPAKIPKISNKKVLDSQIAELDLFPTSWAENQGLLHSTYEITLNLALRNLSISKRSYQIFTFLIEEVNLRIEKQLAAHMDSLDQWLEKAKAAKDPDSIESLAQDETPFPVAETVLQQYKANTIGLLPEDAHLLNNSMLDDFESQQLDNEGAVNLDVAKIADYIIETRLNGPLQEALESYLMEVSNIYYNQINRINLLLFSIKELEGDNDGQELLDSVREKFAPDLELYEKTKLKFEGQINAMIYDLQMALDNRYLVENADNWSRFINVTKRKKGLAKVADGIKTKIQETYTGFYTAISTRKHQTTVSLYESRHNLKGNIELGNEFVKQIYPVQSVFANLPFYYKHLFLGKHLPVQNEYLGREREIARYNESITANKNAVVLVLGASGTGKSHFCEFILDRYKSEKIVRIEPVGKKGSVAELAKVIEAATGTKGSPDQCFTGLTKESVVLISDVEAWWDRAREKDALSVLLSLIEKFSKSHHFIINGNIHALEVLRLQKELDSLVNTTIVLSPLHHNVVRDILIERHKIGGLDMVYKEEYNGFSSRKFQKLFMRLYAESKGSIGIALLLWLRSIDEYSENRIYINEYQPVKYPRISDQYWKWLLYQFVINNHLSPDRISSLFDQDSEEINRALTELVKSGIVEKISTYSYSINSTIKPIVENWLVEQNILN